MVFKGTLLKNLSGMFRMFIRSHKPDSGRRISFESKLRSDAAGLMSSIQTKQVLAAAFLFRAIFARTGPLSHYLQGIDVDFSKALSMTDCVISSLDEMRNGSFDILAKIDAAVSDLGTFEWLYSRLHSKRASGPSEVQTQEEVWKRNTLYVVLHKILSSLRDSSGLRIIEHCMRGYQYSILATSPCL